MKKVKWLIVFLMMLLITLPLTACGDKAESSQIINYADAESFEAALNNGENLEGKIVQFVAVDFKPDSALGYNIWAGEHLNFISERNPDVKMGDNVVVKATTIKNNLGSWVIEYEKVDNAVTDDSTIFSNKEEAKDTTDNASSQKTESLGYEGVKTSGSDSNGNGTTSFSVNNPQSEQPLELVDYGWYIQPSTGDTTYINFCGMIHNPNKDLIAEFPKIIATVKNGDGSIVTTEEQVGSNIMSEDTITLCGMTSVPTNALSEGTQITFDVDLSEWNSGTSMYGNVRTSDFAISNVSENSIGDGYRITGEITNNYKEDIETVNLAVVLRKEGKIVYLSNTFLDSVKAGNTKAFEISIYDKVPEHDMIDVSAMVW